MTHPSFPQNASAQPAPIPPRPALPVATTPPPVSRRFIPRLGSWLTMAFVLVVLIAVALPVFNTTCVKGTQTMALSRSKQIGLALKIFASEHDDNYPRAGLPDMLGANPQDANAAFAVLFPQYTTSESLFGNNLSAYQTRAPDNVYDPRYTGHPVETLAPGENVYAYVAGLTERSAPDSPLLADGTDGTGHYPTDRKKRGGVWEGGKAVVVRLDNSAAIEALVGPDDARYVPRHVGDYKTGNGNVLDVSNLGPGVRLLDPAVASGLQP